RQPIQVPDVDPLQYGDPRVLAEAPGQLSIPDVDRDDARGASLQQEVGEAPGRRADIKAYPSCRIDAEGIERGRELIAATADIGFDTVEVDADIGVDHLIRPVRQRAAHAHQSGTHHRLRALPRGHE